MPERRAMPELSPKKIVNVLLRDYGRTFAEELGIRISNSTPAELYKLLCASLLFSVRISVSAAEQAFRALMKNRLTTPHKMATSTWEARTRILNKSGYARYDESTSRYLGQSADLVLTKYKGDLRKLRAETNRDPEAERGRLKEFKGVGNTGVDIFFREAQLIWDELYPFLDARSAEEARKLGLPEKARDLAALCGKKEYPRLVAALVRVKLERAENEVLQKAAV